MNTSTSNNTAETDNTLDWTYASGSIAFFGIITNTLTLIYFVKQDR